MPRPPASDKPADTRRSIFRHPAFRLLALLLVPLLVLAVALPALVGHAVKTWLEEQGASQVAIEQATLNPFRGTLVLRGLRIDGGRSPLAAREIRLTFAWLPLWERQAVIENLVIKGLRAQALRSAHGGWQLAGLAAPLTGQDPDKPGWRLVLNRFSLQDSSLEAFDGERVTGIQVSEALYVRHRDSGNGNKPPAASDEIQLHKASMSWQLPAPGHLAIGKAQIRALGLRPGQPVEVSEFTAEEVSLHADREAKTAPTLAIARLLLRGGAFTVGKEFSAREVELHDAQLRIRRERDGHWQLPITGTMPIKSSAGPNRLGVRLESISLHGDSRLLFEDATVEPMFSDALQIETASLTGLDSRRPGSPARLTLRARLGQHARLTLNGELKAFADRPVMNLRGATKGISLPSLSGYAARHLGYELKSGQLDADFELQIVAGTLAGESRLLIRNPEITPKDDELIRKLTTQLTMPLDSAVLVLRDKNNDVRLRITVQGNINDPKFAFNDALNQAIIKALRTGALSYLKHILQPYGTYISLAEMAGKAGKSLLRLRLDPVYFAPGSPALDAAGIAYLTHVASLLGEKPSLRLRLCARVTAGEMASDANGTLALGDNRAAIVKEYLVNQHGIDADRLFLCKPELDKATDASPRVELLI